MTRRLDRMVSLANSRRTPHNDERAPSRLRLDGAHVADLSKRRVGGCCHGTLSTDLAAHYRQASAQAPWTVSGFAPARERAAGSGEAAAERDCPPQHLRQLSCSERPNPARRVRFDPRSPQMGSCLRKLLARIIRSRHRSSPAAIGGSSAVPSPSPDGIWHDAMSAEARRLEEPRRQRRGRPHIHARGSFRGEPASPLTGHAASPGAADPGAIL